MTEFEERLTHEYSKLAEQYAQEQTRLSAQVESLGKQVRQLAGQYAQEQKKHAEWIGELGVRVTTLTDASNRVTSELNELFH